MKILAIDASGITAGAAIISNEKVIAEFNINCGLTHSQALMPLIDSISRMAKVDLSDVDYIACTSGPGSFTGLRIGVSCAKGLAAGLSKDMIPVPTLDALAYNICKTNAYVAPIMDAKRGQLYYAFYKYETGTDSLKRISGYSAMDIFAVIREAETFDEEVIFLGDGVISFHEVLTKNPKFTIASSNNLLQRGGSVGKAALFLAEKKLFVKPEDFKIIYLRKPQAEREYEEKAKRG